jgi:hypothetical protein
LEESGQLRVLKTFSKAFYPVGSYGKARRVFLFFLKKLNVFDRVMYNVFYLKIYYNNYFLLFSILIY